MDVITKVSRERFSEGITIEEFIQGMGTKGESFIEAYRGFAITEKDTETLRGWVTPLRVLVLAEDWCGDVLRYVPILWKMSDAAGKWEVRVFYRDHNPDLAELWLKEGKYRAIPVIVFFDNQMNELACYIEKPAPAYMADEMTSQAFIQEHPEMQDAYLPSEEMSDETRRLYHSFARAYRLMLREQWKQMFVDEILSKLRDALAK
ncbi:MAG: thioredoxin family protein [Chloroflexota bacterium]|nr:thioredoxin family protein [Chloroflexota bacterium]